MIYMHWKIKNNVVAITIKRLRILELILFQKKKAKTRYSR
jgi:hypothetical protein